MTDTRKKVFKCLLIFAGFFITAVLMELVSVFCLGLRGIPRRAFLLNRLPHIAFIDKGTQYPFVDPLLGYAADKPFVEYSPSNRPSNLLIVTLGGSTTAPYPDKLNWSKSLVQTAEKRGFALTVKNGGVGGYSTNQELIKLIRDVLPLRPNLVVTYDGINDFGHNSVAHHPLHHPYQKQVFETVLNPISTLLPNSVYFGQLVSDALLKKPKVELRYGQEDAETPVENWAKNIKLMHAISKESGIKYVAFLQPTLGEGTYLPTEREARELAELSATPGYQYDEVVKKFYSEARPRCGRLSYCVDISQLFNGKTDLYADPRHPNDTGYRIIGERILEELLRRKLIPS